MTEMVERVEADNAVVEAICEIAIMAPPAARRKIVRAIIAAMREPTNRMGQAGCAAGSGGNWGGTVEKMWRAMIDAALEPRGAKDLAPTRDIP